jgi:two-component system chemotaxis response regulator CheB
MMHACWPSIAVAQDEAGCAVFGMPREAIALGAADETLPLAQIAPHLIAALGMSRAIRV